MNANFIRYATQLLGGGGLGFFLNSEFDFLLKLYTYKLLQAFPPKHL